MKIKPHQIQAKKFYRVARKKQKKRKKGEPRYWYDYWYVEQVQDIPAWAGDVLVKGRKRHDRAENWSDEFWLGVLKKDGHQSIAKIWEVSDERLVKQFTAELAASILS